MWGSYILFVDLSIKLYYFNNSYCKCLCAICKCFNDLFIRQRQCSTLVDNSYLKIPPFIMSVWGSENGHFPVVHISLVHQCDFESLHRLLLKALHLQHECFLWTSYMTVVVLCHTGIDSGPVVKSEVNSSLLCLHEHGWVGQQPTDKEKKKH